MAKSFDQGAAAAVAGGGGAAAAVLENMGRPGRMYR